MFVEKSPREAPAAIVASQWSWLRLGVPLASAELLPVPGVNVKPVGEGAGFVGHALLALVAGEIWLHSSGRLVIYVEMVTNLFG